MSLFKAAQSFNTQIIRISNGHLPLTSLLRHSPHHHFSTTTTSDSSDQPLIDPFLKPPPQGVVYGRLRGVNENMQKTDVQRLFDDTKLTLDDIKADYTRIFRLMSMLVQFPSLAALNAAYRTINQKGRLFRLEPAKREEWDMLTPYDGRHVLLQGIPRNALVDDVERFLSDCNYESSSFEMFTRGTPPDSIKMVKVRFPSHIEAMSAVIRKNGGFCLNNRIIARVLL